MTRVFNWAVATAGVTFLLLLVGGIVHGTGSSLACPDWPTCYGDIAPPMTGGIFYEHGHRMLAMGVGMMTIGLLVMCALVRREDRAMLWLGIAALIVVIFQGVLGGLTVIYRLPTAVSTGHLATSMVYFALLIYIAARARRVSIVPAKVSPGVRRLIGLAVAAVYAQIVIGALVRHTGAGLACLDVPFCNGELWPSAAHATAKLQMVHRIVGAGVGLLAIGAGVAAFRAARPGSRTRWLAASIPVLVVVQVTLGLLSVTSMLGLWQVTAHLGGGAALLAVTWALWLSTRAEAVVETASVGLAAEARS